MQRLGDTTLHNAPEHSAIHNMLQTGYPDGKESEYPHCPVCGAECESIYMDETGDIFACDECVKERDAWDVEECFSGGRRL